MESLALHRPINSFPKIAQPISGVNEKANPGLQPLEEKVQDEMEEHTMGFPSFAPFFEVSAQYYALLNGLRPELVEEITACVQASNQLEDEVCALMALGWRSQIVGAVALLCGAATPRTIAATWRALDQDSWAAPQLAVVIAAVDPDAPREMRKRLLLGCPVLPASEQDEPSPPKRQVQQGASARSSLKAWTTYCWRVGMEAEGMSWLLARFSAEEALQRLLALYGHEGSDIANSWHKDLREKRPDLDLPPAMEVESPCKFLAQHWCTPERLATLDCPPAVLEALLAETFQAKAILEPLLAPGLRAGDEQFEIRAAGVKSRSHFLPLTPALGKVILDWIKYGLQCLNSKMLGAVGVLPDLVVQSPEEGVLLVRRPAPPRELEGRINLCRDRLENARTQAVCYGAKDTGEMGGGAAIAVYQACGPQLLDSLREGLAKTSREVGEVVVTPAFLHPEATHVGHIISIKTRTSRGDWCPAPENLGQGVYRALEKLDGKVKTVALSCLATGEGRAEPDKVATLMLGAARKYFKAHPASELKVLFCLPSFRDYQAFEKALAR